MRNFSGDACVGSKKESVITKSFIRHTQRYRCCPCLISPPFSSFIFSPLQGSISPQICILESGIHNISPKISRFCLQGTHFPIRAFLLGICSLWKPQNELIDKIWTASHKRKAKEKSQRSSNWPNKHSCTNNQNFFFDYSCVGWSIDNKFDASVADSFRSFRREHWWFIKQSIFRFQAFA